MTQLGIEKQNYTNNIHYHEGKSQKISPKVTNGVKSALKTLGDKTNNTFFKTIDVHVMSRIKDLKPFNKYSQDIKEKESSNNFLALFKLSDSDVYVNQKGILEYLKEQNIPLEDFTKHLVIHEVGHYFDEYYGCNIENYSEIIDYLNTQATSKTKQNYNISKLAVTTNDNNSLSDEKIFKETLLKDLSNLNKKELYTLGLISDSEFIDPTFSTKKFIRETTEKFYTNPEASETMRSEIFAQIFSYIIGSEDSLKDKYLKSYPNTIQLIQSLISEKKDCDKNNNQKFEILF